MNRYDRVTAAEYRRHRGKIRPGTRTLRDVVMFAQASKGQPVIDLGIVNDRPVRGGSALSLHSVGRAWDTGVRRPSDRWILDVLFGRLVAAAPLCKFDEVIYARQRWNATTGRLETYTGEDPHVDHIHTGLDPAVADVRDTGALATWFANAIYGPQ